MTAAGYQPPQAFRTWADATGYGNVELFRRPASHARVPHLYDMDRDGVVTTSRPRPATGRSTRRAHATGTSTADGFVSDDERDEDGDGLTTTTRSTGPMTAGLVDGCYPTEGEYPIPYAGTKAYDADSDGDGILDGADDQDFDDVPNIMELSRNMAGNMPIQQAAAATPASSRRRRHRPRPT